MHIKARLAATSFALALLTAGMIFVAGERDSNAADGAAAKRLPGVTYDAQGKPAGLARYIAWSKRVGQGAQPEGDVGFRNLHAMGYRTILSVDGSAPEVERAKKFGLRYVHVPIGYDGITHPQAVAIVKAGQSAKESIFVHCHHGKHRGPAAAMLVRMSEDKISAEEAVKGLVTSGTSKNYTGLWRDVKAFKMPTAKELAAVKALPSRVLPVGLRASMVGVSHRYEALQLAKKSAWKQPKDHPDIDPPHEARMLWELCRELARTDKTCRAKGDVFLKYLKAAEDEAIGLEKALRTKDMKAADKRFAAIKNTCAACHRDYRN